ncbi:uncharacterized protein LOC135810659 [Sycon ciliatum]|uniref:uncharacterized protein LOC135810659 n=1 Tax=Sycon ciliatum TaxID=27933 RepID=UPI0031F6C776
MKLPIQLPKLSLPTFDGDLLAWPDFFDMFSCAVDSQAIPEVSKFAYLKSVLHGRASRLICGLAITGVNYPIAVAALKAEFARPELIVSKLYTQLQQIPSALNTSASIKQTLEHIESLLQQLEAQGEVLTGQRLISQQILTKFPIEVTFKIEEWRPLDQAAKPWDIATLRQALKRYSWLQDTARHRADSTATVNPGIPAPPMPGSSTAGTASALPATVYSPQEPAGQRQRRPCVVCSASHSHDECKQYATATARKERLMQLQCCFRCLGKGHRSAACTRDRKCRHCLQANHHNTAICTQPATGHASAGRTPSTFTTVASGHSSPTSSVQLQTATVTLHHSNKSVRARVLLDTGSQRTFLTSALADTLALRTQRTEYLLISTFAGAQPHQLATPVVDFSMSLQDSSMLEMTAHVLTKITDPVASLMRIVNFSSLSPLV